MKEIRDMDIGELAAFVCSHLYKNGMKCVLSGGACVSIYTNNDYQSYDIDLIDNFIFPRKKLKKLLSEIDFYEENRYFKHKDTNLFIEFPSGPLSVGSEVVKMVEELEYSTGLLFILSPTDCVKDRLCGYYFWDDIQSLEQAISVSKNQVVDFQELRRWSENENKLNEFEKFYSFIK